MNDDAEAVDLEVTIVVPTWRRAEWLHRCLGGVTKQTIKPASILVIGRDEDHDARAVVDSFVDATWLTVERPGHVEPLRVALERVTTPLMAILDDDAEPLESDWLAQLRAPFRDARVACVGSEVRNVGLERPVVRPDAGFVKWYGRIIGNVASRSDASPVSVDTVQEANWMWRSDVLRKCTFDSLWDDGDAAMYGVDLCLQAKAKGWLVLYTAAAPVAHHLAPRAGATIHREDVSRRSYAFSRNCTYIALKHFGKKLLPFFAWSLLVGERYQYGVASAAFEIVTGGRPRNAVAASFRGRIAGFRAWWRWRRNL